MKIWTPNVVLKCLLTRFDLQQREKKPFPSQFPTRVYARIGDFRYLGKPSYRAYMQIRKAFAKHGYGEYAIVEFDRGGPIYAVVRADRGARQIVKQNEKLWTAYHPHQYPDYLLSWMSYDFRLGKSGWYVMKGREEDELGIR